MNKKSLEALRIQAVKKHLAGQNPKAICKALSMSKRWLFKLIKRYQSGKRNWFKEKSKTPHTIYRKTSFEIEKKVITIRRYTGLSVDTKEDLEKAKTFLRQDS